MEPQIYFFGTPPGGFSSYPQDHTKAFFEEFIKRSRNALQIVVHRSDNLLHYGYVRRIGKDNYFGICICTDRIYNDVSNIFKTCDDIFADIINKGDILSMTSKPNFSWATRSYANESVAIHEYSQKIIRDLRISNATTQELPPPDYSVSINDCIDISLEEPKKSIVEVTKRYPNIYIVKKNSEIERVSSFVSQLNAKEQNIRSLKEEIEEQKKHASGLRTELMKARATQRNMLWVGLLSVVVAVLGVILYFKVINPSEVTHYNTGEYIYYGPMKNKRPNGIGVAFYPSDDKDGRKYYLGRFVNGKRQDTEAFLFYQDGDYYYGAMDGDELTDGMLYMNTNNSHFVGKFRNNEPYTGTWYSHEKYYSIEKGVNNYNQ